MGGYETSCHKTTWLVGGVLGLLAGSFADRLSLAQPKFIICFGLLRKRVSFLLVAPPKKTPERLKGNQEHEREGGGGVGER